MATIQKRGISLLLVLVLMLGMVPSVSATEIDTEPSTEPAETTTPVPEETLAAETSPPEATQPEETSPPETTQPEPTAPAETAPEETEPPETEPPETSDPVETQPVLERPMLPSLDMAVMAASNDGMVNNLRSAAEEVVLREIVDRVRTDKANQKIRGKIRGFFNLRTANDFYKMISGKHQKQFMSKQGGNCKIRMNAIAVFSCIMLGEMPLKPLKIAVAIKKLSYCNHTVIKFGGDKCMDFFIRGNVQIKN